MTSQGPHVAVTLGILGLDLRVIDRVEEFEALESVWDELVARSSGTPFMLSTYVAQGWRSGRAPAYCVVAERAGRLVGGLPLLVRKRLGAREAVPLGGEFLADLLCDPDEPDTTALAILSAVREIPVDFMPVRGVTPHSALARAVPGYALHWQDRRILELEMPDGWEAAYRERTSSKSRNNDQRKLRRLHELGNARFEVATTNDAVQRALTDAFEIYRRRWLSRPGEHGGFATYQDGWRTVAKEMSSRGQVQIVSLRVDDSPAAFTYSFLFNRTIWIRRLAFDSSLEKYSPGWLTVVRAIRAASDAGARRVNFGVGDEPYKQRLATSSTELMWGIAIKAGIRGALAGRLYEASFRAGRHAKQNPVLVTARDWLWHVTRSRGLTREPER
jgi:CelD/BcsL family acetyltransferase involved in cellulose biosynthesis